MALLPSWKSICWDNSLGANQNPTFTLPDTDHPALVLENSACQATCLSLPASGAEIKSIACHITSRGSDRLKSIRQAQPSIADVLR
jgi:hypothetical protein